jgi:hypothetical protein
MRCGDFQAGGRVSKIGLGKIRQDFGPPSESRAATIGSAVIYHWTVTVVRPSLSSIAYLKLK